MILKAYRGGNIGGETSKLLHLFCRFTDLGREGEGGKEG